MIKTVIFDLGKVLVPFDFSNGYKTMAALCPYSAEEIPARIGETGLVPRFECGEVPADRFVEELCAALEAQISYDRFCDIWTSIFLPHTLIPDGMLAGLAQRYRLLLLSNTNSIHFPMVREKYPLLRHFHDYVLSYEVGALKPSPRIYESALRLAQCEPEECFFTDDIAEYVAGARRAGIDAVQFHSAEQIQRELAARGVKWE